MHKFKITFEITEENSEYSIDDFIALFKDEVRLSIQSIPSYESLITFTFANNVKICKIEIGGGK